MKAKMAGFSFIELLCTLVILSVMLFFCNISIDVYHKYKVNAFSHLLFNTLQYARTQAIKSNTLVRVCPTQDYISCSPHWNKHLMVINPKTNECYFQGIIPNTIVFAAKDYSTIDFTGNGQALWNATLIMTLHNYKKTIIVSNTGRVRLD